MQRIAFPYAPAFSAFLESLQDSCLICSPYITMPPARQLVRAARDKGIQASLTAQVVTDISAANLVSGATDLEALLVLAESLPRTSIVYLPRVHAKVYVSADSLAIVGSANLTNAGLSENLEYGISTTDRGLIRTIRRDLQEYAALGAEVPYGTLLEMRGHIASARDAVRAEQTSISRKLRQLSQELLRKTEDELIRVRVRGRSVHAIFGDTIRYLLRHRAMTTVDLHRQVQRLHTDLCDDTLDRVIDGEHFGKLWKHQVRNAQQHLKRTGAISYDPVDRVWALAPGAR